MKIGKDLTNRTVLKHRTYFQDPDKKYQSNRKATLRVRPQFPPGRNSKVKTLFCFKSEFGLGSALERSRTSVGFEWMWRELLGRTWCRV